MFRIFLASFGNARNTLLLILLTFILVAVIISGVTYNKSITVFITTLFGGSLVFAPLGFLIFENNLIHSTVGRVPWFMQLPISALYFAIARFVGLCLFFLSCFTLYTFCVAKVTQIVVVDIKYVQNLYLDTALVLFLLSILKQLLPVLWTVIPLAVIFSLVFFQPFSSSFTRFDLPLFPTLSAIIILGIIDIYLFTSTRDLTQLVPAVKLFPKGEN